MLLPLQLKGVLSDKQAVQDLVKERLLETRNAFYIGRHLDYYVAMEAALKLKEKSHTCKQKALPQGNSKHGTIALIEEGTPVIALLSEPVVAKPHSRKYPRSESSWRCRNNHCDGRC